MARTLLQRGAAMLRDKALVAAAETVSVIDGAEAIDNIEMIPGRRDIEQYLLEEATGTAKSFDWCADPADLSFAGAVREPQTGWLIRWRIPDGRTLVYRVQPQGGRVFDNVDQLGLLLRIHTKLERVEAAA